MAGARAHVFAAFLVVFGLLLGGQTRLFNSLFDIRTGLYPRAATADVVVVAVDAISIEKIGIWPWPRSLHAKIIDQAQKAGAKDIAFDVDFSSPSSEKEDDAFANALKNASSVILPAFLQTVGDQLRLTQPLARFRSLAWTALVNVRPDADGIVRQYPFGELRNGEEIPSMASMLVGSGAHNGAFYIDFSIASQTIPVVSYVDVLDGKPEAVAKIKGRKVIVGGTALELGDRLAVSGGGIIAGPVLQALAAESLHQNRGLLRVGASMSWCAAALIALVMFFTWRDVSGWRRASLLALLTIVSEGMAIYAQSLTTVAWDTAPIHFVTLSYLMALTLDELDLRGMIGRVSERRFKRITMSLSDALICTDSAGNITTCNPAAESMFGLESASLFGRNLKYLLRKSASEPLDLGKVGVSAEDAEGLSFDQVTFPAEIRVSSWDSENQPQYGIIIRDVSDKRREEEKIRRLAEHDFLTGLANRYTLNRTVERYIDGSDTNFSLLLFDLDRFKEINDTYGHAFGDIVIKALSDRLLALMEAGCVVGRLGGDEFAILMNSSCDLSRKPLSARILEDFSTTPIIALERILHLRATIGISSFPDDAANAEELFSNADLALYRAKADGGSQCLRFEKRFREELEQKLQLENELSRATENGEFEVFYQPQIGLADGIVTGAEALIRWRHPTRGIVSPAEFLPFLNQSKLSDAVGRWVLRTACTQAAAWRSLGHEIRIGVNLAPSQLQSANLFSEVLSALEESGLPANLLEIEVTEDNVLSNEAQSNEVIRVLRETGVRIAFDDFGTGYASLTHLKKLKLDVLKIDRSFVKDLDRSSDDLAIVRSIITLGKNLGMSLIAEGIEDKQTAEILRALGCDEAQGYYFGRPMPAVDFLSFLNRNIPSRKFTAA